MDFDSYCRAAGRDPDTLSDHERSELLAQWKADMASTVEVGLRGELNAVFGRYASACPDRRSEFESILQAAAHQRWDANRCELEMLRASRPRGSFMAVPSEPAGEFRVAEASLLLARGVPGETLLKSYGERVVDAADSPEWRGLGLHALMRMTLRAAGQEPPAGRFTDTSIRAALKADAALSVKAIGSWGPSTSGASMSSVLSNVANKLLLQGWAGTGTTWQTFCRVGTDLSDFKQSTRYRMTGIGTFQVIPPGGEIKHVQVDAETYSQQLGTRGAMIGIDRTALINDDLSVFDTVPRSLGRMAAIAVEKAVYTLLLQQASTFFTAGRKNLSTGAGSALADAGLTAAWQLARQQTDANGDPLMVAPAVMLVPPALEMTAAKLNQSTAVVASTTAGTTLPAGNPWAGKFTVVAAPYLGLATAPAGTTGSDTGWYIALPPGDFAVMEIAFLNGQRVPTVESSDADFGMLGMQWRGFLDFGVAMLEYRGGVRSAGA